MQKNKFYTKETKIGTQEILKYYICCDDTKEQCKIYEIVIEKWIGERMMECETTGGLTKNYQKAETFLNLLYRNKVTPFSLLEVTDDCFYAMI